MSTSNSNLYEILGIAKDASNEQIRKAYKKKALQTHPDRLGPGASPADKASAEEQFGKVNNAYEVLNDPKNRKLYDRHGVWPPEEPNEERPRRRSTGHQRTSDPRYMPFQEPFGGPFFNGRHRTRPFAFTDPFTLFNNMFGEMNRQETYFTPMFDDPSRRARRDGPIFGPHFMPDPFDNPNFPFGPNPPMPFGLGSAFPPSQSRSTPFPFESRHSGGRGGRWTQESTMTQTINGVTQSIWTRRDADGNEHVTLTYPDGREHYTVNGVEQRNDRYIPPPPPYPGLEEGHSSRGHKRSRSERSKFVPPPPPPPTTHDHGSFHSHAPPPIIPSSHDRDYDRRDGSSKRRWWGASRQS